MKILCVICHDLLIPSEDISFIRCGHVFHYHCLLQWLDRSRTCPQCRDRATENRIHKAHFTFSNTEITADNVDNSPLQGKIDSLQFQVLLNEKNIKHYTSKNAILEKQNAGLRQEVRKVESEISQKNSTIYALKEQLKYFKDKNHLTYDMLKKKLSQKEREMMEFREITSRKTKKIENLQHELERHRQFLKEERSKRLKSKVRLTSYKVDNISLQHRVNELEKLLKITSDQNYITDSRIQRNSNENSLINIQPVDICNQEINVKQETTNQNGLSSLETEIEIITDMEQEHSICNQEINVKQETTNQNDSSSLETEVEIITDTEQEHSIYNSSYEECSTVSKQARLCLQSGNGSDRINDIVMID